MAGVRYDHMGQPVLQDKRFGGWATGDRGGTITRSSRKTLTGEDTIHYKITFPDPDASAEIKEEFRNTIETWLKNNPRD